MLKQTFNIEQNQEMTIYNFCITASYSSSLLHNKTTRSKIDQHAWNITTEFKNRDNETKSNVNVAIYFVNNAKVYNYIIGT